MDNWKSLLDQATKMFEEKRFVEAGLKYEEVLRIKPDMPDVYNKLGVIYLFTNKYDKGIECFKKALDINPEYVEARVNLALALNTVGEYDEASYHLTEAARIEKEKGEYYAIKTRLANLHKETGKLYLEMEDRDSAIEEFRKALKLMPHFVDIRLLLAETLMEVGNMDEAEDILIESINIKPMYANSYILLGQLYLKKGDEKKAKEMWEECLKIDPENNVAKVYINQLKKGE